MREILPNEMTKPVLVLFGFALGVGHDFIYIVEQISMAYADAVAPLIIIFFVPAFIAGIQLSLSFLYFKLEPPQYLYENQDEENCMIALLRIYPDPDRRMMEYNRLVRNLEETRYKYPSYTELFTKEYLPTTLKGILIIILRNFTGGFYVAMFSGLLYENNSFQMKINIITDTLNTIMSIAPFFYINSIFIIYNRNWIKTPISYINHNKEYVSFKGSEQKIYSH